MRSVQAYQGELQHWSTYSMIKDLRIMKRIISAEVLGIHYKLICRQLFELINFTQIPSVS